MKAAIIVTLLLSSSTMASSPLSEELTAEQLDMVIQMSVNQMKADDEFTKMASCVNQSEAKVESVFREVMRACVEKHMLEEDDEKTTACLVSNFSEKLGVSAEKFTACSEQE
ncbi:hypothetical protein A9267_16435 [Shewanella sp. UCD-FRSSP16_17]|uniref:hypothetical protein n=1 Tax=Shewanella TaxID=22 RepID=UPI0007EEC0BC|nr:MULTISPECIES: hypothetical protein [Shewanella]MBQ4890268.1 hypothetical protein [Shewanella sp. MMG014]OBT05438.1 hypothetical protein A9267_16435 [Shewanella sp. UCD-FRSSP16_17]